MPYADKEKEKEAKRKYEQKRKGTRGENWAIIVYPAKEYLDSVDSKYDGWDGYGTAPKNWISLIDELHIPYCVSPLHDKDLHEGDDNKTKKPHWHLILKYSSMKTLEQVKEVADMLNAPAPKRLQNLQAYTRYLTHMDNANKAQYDSNAVICGGGFDYISIIQLASDKYVLVSEMIRFIELNNLYSYRRLVMYAQNNNEQWFRALCDNCSYIIKEYLQSRAWEDGVHGGTGTCRNDVSVKCDKETGEVEKLLLDCEAKNCLEE